MTFTKEDSRLARRELRKLFKEYNTRTVFVVQRGVSRSGMTRWLDLYLIPSYQEAYRFYKNFKPRHNLALRDKFRNEQIEPRVITYLVAQALEWSYSNTREALVVNGCGMDMHFHTVYSLSHTLYCRKHYDKDKAYFLKTQTI